MDDSQGSGPNGTATASPPAPAERQEIIRRPKALSQRDPLAIAKAFAKSGYFKDVKSEAQAAVKIIAGEELGLGPMAAMEGLTLIEGKLGFRGNLVATLVKQHPTYDYKVVETTDEKCILDFYDGDEKVGRSEFTVKDAERAGLIKAKGNWEKYPKAMCFNRALTQGVRTYIPDVTAGAPAYTDDEIEEAIVDVQSAAESDADAPAPAGIGWSEVAQKIVAGIEAVGVNLDEVDILLGSLGIDALAEHSKDALLERVKGLTLEQAEALEAELDRIAEEQVAEEVTG
jgi:hypothetical protein